MEKNKKFDKTLDLLAVFTSAFMIVMLIPVTWYSLLYWANNYPMVASIEYEMFYIGVMIAVITSLYQWIDGRIAVLIRLFNKFSKEKKGGKNDSKRNS